MTGVSLEDLEAAGDYIRESQFTGGDLETVSGACRDASEALQYHLDKRYDLQSAVVELAVGEARAVHFVVTVDTEYVSDVDLPGRVIVDVALDQFCSENGDPDVTADLGPRRYIDSVGVYPPGAEERYVWYTKPNCHPEEAHADVFGNQYVTPS